jgi:hypothetical protein
VLLYAFRKQWIERPLVRFLNARYADSTIQYSRRNRVAQRRAQSTAQR